FEFASPGTYTVHGRIFDQDGGFTDYTTTVTVRTASLRTQPPVLPPGGLPPLPVPVTLGPAVLGPATPLAPAAPAARSPVIPPGGGMPAGDGAVTSLGAVVQSELGPGFNSGSYSAVPPSVSAAVFAQMRGNAQLFGGDQDGQAPEAEALVQATQV